MKPRWRWTLWTVFVILWTIALTRPVPDLSGIVREEILAHRYAFAKTLHVGIYALFAMLTGWLRCPLPWRPALMFFVMAHATATEHIQLHVEGRTGTLQDVGFDHVGILAGFLLSWRWWTQGERPGSGG